MSDLIVLHGCATVQLTKGLNTLIDERDAAWVEKNKWCSVETKSGFYAATHVLSGAPSRRRYLHRDIAATRDGDGLPAGAQVDHKSRDGLDNRRENLRVATVGQNRSNSRKKLWRGGKSSDYKGVSWHKASRKWRAVIVKDKAQRELGRFDDEKEAARAYNRAAVELHGEFARINEDV